MVSLQKKEKKINEIEFYVVAFLSLLPSGSIYEYFKLFVVIFLVFEKAITGTLFFNIKTGIIIILLVFLTATSYVMSVFSSTINGQALLHEFKRNLFLCALILVCSNIDVNFKTIYRLCAIFLCLNTFIQLLELFKVEFVFDFIEKYYVTSEDGSVHLELAKYKSLRYFRAGSIFLNPNIYMIIPLVSMAVFLQRSLIEKSRINKLMIFIAAISMFLAGSRTAFIIVFLLVFIYFINRRIKPSYKITLIIIEVLFLLICFLLADKYRFFDFASGLDNSIGFKMRQLIDYLKNLKPISLLLGALSQGGYGQLDFEIGYIFAYYGMVGLIWFGLVVFSIEYGKEKYKFLTVAIRGVLVCMACTATILLCMPICSFFISLALLRPIKEING